MNAECEIEVRHIVIIDINLSTLVSFSLLLGKAAVFQMRMKRKNYYSHSVNRKVNACSAVRRVFK